MEQCFLIYEIKELIFVDQPTRPVFGDMSTSAAAATTAAAEVVDTEMQQAIEYLAQRIWNGERVHVEGRGGGLVEEGDTKLLPLLTYFIYRRYVNIPASKRPFVRDDALNAVVQRVVAGGMQATVRLLSLVPMHAIDWTNRVVSSDVTNAVANYEGNNNFWAPPMVGPPFLQPVGCVHCRNNCRRLAVAMQDRQRVIDRLRRCSVSNRDLLAIVRTRQKELAKMQRKLDNMRAAQTPSPTDRRWSEMEQHHLHLCDQLRLQADRIGKMEKRRRGDATTIHRLRNKVARMNKQQACST